MRSVIDKLDEVPEPVRSEYEQRKDGKFQLKVEGPAYVRAEEHETLSAKLGTFRDTNSRLLKALGAESVEDGFVKLEKFKSFDPEKFKDVDPEEYRKLKEQAEKLGKKGIKDADELEARVADLVAKALKPVTEKLSASEQREKEANERVRLLEFETKIGEEAKKLGALETAGTDIVSRVLGIFDLDGKARDDDGQIVYSKSGDPLTVREFLADLAIGDGKHLFKATKGGGIEPGTPPGRGSNVRTLVNPSPQELGRFAKEIAKGEIVVQSQ